MCKANSYISKYFCLPQGPLNNHMRLRKIQSTEQVLFKEALCRKGVFSFNKKVTNRKYDIFTKKKVEVIIIE